MAIRIPYGIDPAEVWEVDYCAAAARAQLDLQQEVERRLREAALAAKDEENAAALRRQADKAAAEVKAAADDLAGYVPRSGPVFRVRPIPGAKRAELAGRHAEIEAMPVGAAGAVARAEWARDVVRLAVCGHRNLQTQSGREVPYLQAADGGPDDATLEAYSPILVELAWVVLSGQRLGAAGKNA